jgi:hypothetical protein
MGDPTLELIVVIGVLSANLITLAIAWLKFKTTLATIKDEIKNHADFSMQKLNGTLTYFMHSIDRPMWIKTAVNENGKINFRMLELNAQYARAFNIPRQDYIGKTDLEAGWPKEVSDKFYEHDLRVWATGKPETFIEDINGVPMRFRKLLLQTPDGKKKGVCGFAVDASDTLLDTQNVENDIFDIANDEDDKY